MKRYVSLEEISDGRLYELNDMVKVGSNDCAGCNKCCRVSADTIKLDPWDIAMLMEGLHKNFEQLMADGVIELGVVDGIITPNLKIDEEKGCSLLNAEGRCSIHKYRPGFCRLFPLGRYYENGSFKYFLQVNECDRRSVKMKVWKWLDTPDLARHEKFVNDWHNYIMSLEADVAEHASDDAYVKSVNMKLLNDYYLTGDWEKV